MQRSSDAEPSSLKRFQSSFGVSVVVLLVLYISAAFASPMIFLPPDQSHTNSFTLFHPLSKGV